MIAQIPPDLIEFLQEMVSTGQFSDEGAVIVEGLRLLRSREQLRRDVNAGIDQLEAGQRIDGEEVFSQLRQRADELVKNKGE